MCGANRDFFATIFQQCFGIRREKTVQDKKKQKNGPREQTIKEKFNKLLGRAASNGLYLTFSISRPIESGVSPGPASTLFT